MILFYEELSTYNDDDNGYKVMTTLYIKPGELKGKTFKRIF